MLCFLSTRSHQLEDYSVWHSNGEPVMGPFNRSWDHIGRAGSLFNVPPNEPVSYESKQRLCGINWPHYDVYMFESFNEGIDVYVRRATARPAHHFVHYHIDGGFEDIWSGNKT